MKHSLTNKNRKPIAKKKKEGVTTRYSKKDCAICLSEIREQGVLDTCIHRYCLDCIVRWAKIENTCPLCKELFSTISPKQLRVDYRERRVGSTHKQPIRVKSKKQLDPENMPYRDIMEYIPPFVIDQINQVLRLPSNLFNAFNIYYHL